MKNLIETLKGEDKIQPPIWADFVKTGLSKERAPTQKDWWHIRCASLLKKIEKFGPIGVNRLSKQYGGRQNRGVKPEIKKNGSTNIIRKCLQQLELANLVKKNELQKKGKVLTKEGKQLLNTNRKNG